MDHALANCLVDARDRGSQFLFGIAGVSVSVSVGVGVGVGAERGPGAGVDLRAHHLVAQAALLVLSVALYLGLDVGHGLYLVAYAGRFHDGTRIDLCRG